MRRAEPIAGLGGLLLLVSLFLQWYGVSIDTPDTNGLQPEFSLEFEDEEGTSGWAAFTVIDVLLALIAVIAVAVPLVSAFARGPAKPIAIAVIASTLTPLAVLLVVFRILVPPEESLDAFGSTISLEPGLGAWLSLAGALLAFVGSWMSMRDESTPGAVAPDLPRRPASGS